MARYLVTSALPYANGPIHFGQVIGAYLPADVYVRTLRMKGEEVAYVCGTDEYGVAITQRAEKEGVDYPTYVTHWRQDAKRTFDALGIDFDVWSGTSVCPEHAETARDFFRRLEAGGYLIKKTSEQFYSETDGMFLADRYVTGTCYKCGHEGARGDECPSCGSWLEALKLIDPRSALSGTVPELRGTTHWYLDLPRLRDEHIGAWFADHPWKSNVQSFVRNMLEELDVRPITRDLRWGIPVPEEIAGEEEDKVLYVWFDAPIGYVSFTREWAREQGDPELWKRFWKDPETRLVHFIGKDNIPFHCLIFPSMLFGVQDGFVLPWQVPAMEFYNLQGRKFSTSANWTIPIETFLERYDPETARFYLLSSAPESADSEWRWEEYQRCVNTSLADTIGNLATRVLRFLTKNFEGVVPPVDAADLEEMDRVMLTECGPIDDPGERIEAFRFRLATEALLANAAVANVFIDRMAPWALRKTDPARAQSVLNTACEWISLIARWMTPFMPNKAQALWEQLGQEGPVSAAGWPEAPRPGAWRILSPGQKLGAIEGLFPKVEDAEVEAEVEALRERANATS